MKTKPEEVKRLNWLVKNAKTKEEILELCTHGIQNCHSCLDFSCGDNMNKNNQNSPSYCNESEFNKNKMINEDDITHAMPVYAVTFKEQESNEVLINEAVEDYRRLLENAVNNGFEIDVKNLTGYIDSGIQKRLIEAMKG